MISVDNNFNTQTSSKYTNQLTSKTTSTNTFINNFGASKDTYTTSNMPKQENKKKNSTKKIAGILIIAIPIVLGILADIWLDRLDAKKVSRDAEKMFGELEPVDLTSLEHIDLMSNIKK